MKLALMLLLAASVFGQELPKEIKPENMPMVYGGSATLEAVAIPMCDEGKFLSYDSRHKQLLCTRFRIASSYKDGYCDIRGDCWWSGNYCHGCGVNETHPFFVSELHPYLVDELKRGTVIYAPPVKKPTWAKPLKDTP